MKVKRLVNAIFCDRIVSDTHNFGGDNLFNSLGNNYSGSPEIPEK